MIDFTLVGAFASSSRLTLTACLGVTYIYLSSGVLDFPLYGVLETSSAKVSFGAMCIQVDAMEAVHMPFKVYWSVPAAPWAIMGVSTIICPLPLTKN